MNAQPVLSRRRALAWMAAAAALPLVSGSGMVGCSTLRLAGGLLPGATRGARRREGAVLSAFCRTVVPVDPGQEAPVMRVFNDPTFPLARRTPLLVRDLDARAGERGFDRLPGAECRRIVLAGTEARGPIGRIYRGAVLLTQAAFYASIYDDAAGCPAIDWPGAGPLPEPEELTYPHPESFLCSANGADGNPS